ncbi:hypothetical protein ACL02T_19425 [Pseudonocardia sp. RS010]|uniref:hypothetical protein n=1 Tax=Pseudonocardia sp. RS010 TaxID=3385979 RepID=UPI0039A3DA8A
MNMPQFGGRSGFAPLHQAAWHGAGPEVIGRLLERGAWRTLTDTSGRRPVDIARDLGHDDLVPLLSPHEELPSNAADITTYLHAMITVVARTDRTR